MNKRIKKKLHSRCGIFHYRDFNPCNPRVSIKIVDHNDYVTSMKIVDGKVVSFELCHVGKPANLHNRILCASKEDLERIFNT